MKLSQIICFLVAAIWLVFPSLSYARQGSCDEAKRMSINAAAFLKEHGVQKAYTAFHKQDGAYRKDDLYVFVIDDAGVGVIHPTSPSFQDNSMLNIKDILGVPIIKIMLEVKDQGWIRYMYPDPQEGDTPKKKQTYVVRVGSYVVGCGCYEEE